MKLLLYDFCFFILTQGLERPFESRPNGADISRRSTISNSDVAKIRRANIG